MVIPKWGLHMVRQAVKRCSEKIPLPKVHDSAAEPRRPGPCRVSSHLGFIITSVHPLEAPLAYVVASTPSRHVRPAGDRDEKTHQRMPDLASAKNPSMGHAERYRHGSLAMYSVQATCSGSLGRDSNVLADRDISDCTKAPVGQTETRSLLNRREVSRGLYLRLFLPAIPSIP